jgi:SSS family solute:Na+ symporter/sodium/proline symporter
MRVLCAVFVLFSLIVAVFNIQEIFTLMGFSWGTISGAFLAPFLLGVRWKGVTKAGAWAGFITGVTVSVGLSIIAGPLGWKDFTAPLNGSIAMVSSFIMTVVVSLVSKKFEQNVVDEMFVQKAASL